MSRSSKPAVMEGWLEKQSVWLKEWRRRYFRLVGTTLEWSKTPGEAPHGSVYLRHCLTVKSGDDSAGRPFSLELSTRGDEVYLLVAESAKEKDAWIGAISKAIVQSSGSYMRSGACRAGHLPPRLRDEPGEAPG